MKARITVTLNERVLDPQGKAIEGALKSLGFEGIHNVRQGKVFDLDLDVSDRSQAEAILKQACSKLLVNAVIENFNIEIA
jgi:phosphoribosylformylglycinamidine synthase subunit PurS